MRRNISNNRVIAYGALNSGIEVVAGYPGTPADGQILRQRAEITEVTAKKFPLAFPLWNPGW